MVKRRRISPEAVLEERLNACEDIAGLLIVSRMRDGTYEVESSNLSTESICVISRIVDRATHTALAADEAAKGH